MKKAFIAAMAAAVMTSCTTSEILNDKTFEITELNGTEYVAFGSEPAVIIFSDGRLNANLGGNSITASYSEGKDGSIELSYNASTKMLVPDEIREDEFIAALNSVVSFSLEGDVVTLMNADGSPVIRAAVK